MTLNNDIYKFNIHIETPQGTEAILVSMGQFDSKIVGTWLSYAETQLLIKRLKKALKTAHKGTPNTYCDCGECLW